MRYCFQFSISIYRILFQLAEKLGASSRYQLSVCVLILTFFFVCLLLFIKAMLVTDDKSEPLKISSKKLFDLQACRKQGGRGGAYAPRFWPTLTARPRDFETLQHPWTIVSRSYTYFAVFVENFVLSLLLFYCLIIKFLSISEQQR